VLVASKFYCTLRPNGTVFYTGSSDCSPGHTAVYNVAKGTWTRGPDFPSNDAPNDAPAAIETNGNVIVMASLYTGTFTAPANFYEWNGSTLNGFPAPPNAINDASFVGHLLVLPTGQIMFTDFTTDVEILTTAGTFKGSWQPTIKSAPTSLSTGVSNYLITGMQFNGLTQGAAYGDDFQDATNYPLVRIVNNATGTSFTARRTTTAPWAWPRAARVYPPGSMSPPTSSSARATCTSLRTEFHRLP
jgi:hypothetical protein